MSDQLEQDQLDIFGRIFGDEYFSNVPVLLEEKGVTEADIEQALATLNNRGGKNGAVVIVLMPSLAGDSPDAPGPRYSPRFTVQVIDQPLFNLGASGTGKTASQLAERIRTIVHRFRSSAGPVFFFSSQEPIPVDEGRNSYGIQFGRVASDAPPLKCSAPSITAPGTVSPQTVTLASATAGAAIYFTIDGSYPSPVNGTLYTAPFSKPVAGTIRAAASKTSLQQSDVSSAIFT